VCQIDRFFPYSLSAQSQQHSAIMAEQTKEQAASTKTWSWPLGTVTTVGCRLQPVQQLLTGT
jgi:hypothetical protein